MLNTDPYLQWKSKISTMTMITSKANIANRIPIQLRPLLAPGEGTAAEGRGPDPVPWNGITQLDMKYAFH